MNIYFRRAGLSALLVIASVLTLSGQQTGITGRVTDPSKGIISNVSVLATGADGSKFTTLTNSEGFYSFPSLRAAAYLVRFEAPGFAPAERTLTLLVGQVSTVDVNLQLASTSSSVNVESAVASIDTESSTARRRC